MRRPPKSARIPYTTLFRTRGARLAGERQGADQAAVAVEVAAAHAEPVDVAGLQVEAGGAAVVKAAGRGRAAVDGTGALRSEEHTSELQSRQYLECRLLLEK